MNNKFIKELQLKEESAKQLDKVFTKFQARQSENTYRNRKVAIKQFVQFIEGDLENVDSVVVDDWVSFLLSEDYAPRTVRAKTYAISSVFSEFQTRGFIEKNPVEGVEVDDLEQTKQDEYHIKENTAQYLTIEEYEQLIQNAENLRDEVAIRLLWQTGIRVNEAVNVRLSDINREEREITIRTAKTGKYRDDETRTVYYDRKFSTLLRRYIDEGYRDGFVGVSESKTDEGYLLVSNEKYSLNEEYVNEAVSTAAEKAGIQEVMYTNRAGQEMKRVNAHLLRKSYGVHRTKNGMPLAYLSELMGHSDESVTKESYLHFREDDLEEAERKYSP